MSSLTPISANPELTFKKIPFFWLLMKPSSCLMLVRGTLLVEPGGSRSLLNIGSTAILLSWLHKMTECWTDKSEVLLSMKTYIEKCRTSVFSAGSLKSSVSIRKFSSQSAGGTRSRKELILIGFLPLRDIIRFIIPGLFLILWAIMG